MNEAVLRIFVAVPLPPAVTAALAELSGKIRRHGLQGRWVPAANIHLTIAFLGDTTAAMIDRLGVVLADATTRHSAFELIPAGLGVFPGERRARVLWVGLRGDVEALAALTDDVNRGLETLGFPMPARGSTGHLTLARARGEFDPRRITAVLDAHRMFAASSFRVDTIVLYQSLLGSGPARYTSLVSVPLSGAGISSNTGGTP